MVELKEGGECVRVTYENRREYVELALKRRLTEAEKQVHAIKFLFHALSLSLSLCLLTLLSR